jgi:hypothetical protein
MKTTFYKILLHSIIIASLFFASEGYGQGYIAASRYLGGNGTESVSQTIVNNGESYVFGTSQNNDLTNNNTYPVTIGTYNGVADMVVTKLDVNGVIIWSRFLGGTLGDYSIEIKYFNGALYITGISESSNYPVTDNSTLVGMQAPVYTKLNSNTGAIEFSTYLQDYNTSPRINITEGVVYLYGTKIISPLNEDIYITKFNAASNAFINSFTFGGSNTENISNTFVWVGNGQYNSESINENIQVQGNTIYFTCSTKSNDFPVTNGSLFSGFSKTVYVKLNATTGVIQFATYIGDTNKTNSPNGIYLYNGYVYLCYEYYTGDNFHSSIVCLNSTTNILQFSKELTSFGATILIQSGIIYIFSTNISFNGNYDEAFTKLDASNGNEIFSTVLFSPGGGETAITMKVVNGDVYLLGQTNQGFGDSYPTGFPITNGFYPITRGNLLVTLTKIGVDNKICFSTYLGGTELGDGAALISNALVVSNNNIYVSGYISDSFFPVTNATALDYISDFFWIKFEMNPTMPIVADNLLPATQTACKNSFANPIVGDEIIFPSNMMPTIYKNGIPSLQNAIPLKYQWQKANSSTGPWLDIVGGIEQNYTPVIGLVDQFYRRQAFASVCGGTPMSTSSVAAVLVNENTAPDITLGNIINTCAGSSVALGGSPTATGVGGATITSYLWSPVSQTFTPNATAPNPIATPTTNTVYSVTVTDNNGCKRVGLQLVNAYAANAGLDVSSCVGNIVRIGTSAIAGLPGVTYYWVANPADPTMSCNTCAQPDVHPLTPTIYTLTLTIPKTGGGTCSTTDAVLVTPISAPSNADFAGPDRTVCAGSVTMLGTSAMAGFTYGWSPSYFLNNNTIANPVCTTFINSSFPNPIMYHVIATKAGCVFEDSVKITLVGAIARAGADGCGPRTLGFPDETPTINETYQWTVVSGTGHIIGATNTPQINVGASIGADVTYRLTVSLNGVACTDDVVVPVCSCQSPTISVLAQYGCANYNTNAGNVKLVASRTIPSTFTWSPAAGLSNAIGDTVILTDNVQRTYTVTATSIIDTSEHCSSSIMVNNPSNATPVFTAQDVFSCPGVGVSIGQAPVTAYTYIWEETTIGSLSSTGSSNPTATVNTTSIFPVVVTNTLSGCTLRDTATVTVIELPSNVAGTDVKICGTSGIAQLGLPAVAGLTYSWSPAVGLLPNNTTANPTINITNTTTFSVVATNNSTGCSVTDDVTVTVSPTIPAFSFMPVSYCPSTSGAIALPEGPTGMTTYTWSPNYLVLNASSNGPLATTQSTPPSTANTYTLNVTNAGGCTALASVLFTPTATSPVAGSSRTICKNATVQLGAAAQTGLYNWTQTPSTGGSLNSTIISNPVFTPTAVGSYKFVVSKSTAGCTTKDSLTIIVTDFTLPTIPSPIICQNTCIPIGFNSTTTGTQYFWNPTTALSDASISNPIACVTTNSLAYTLTAVGVNGCIATQSMFVTVNPSPSHTVTIAPITACLGATGLSLNTLVSPAGSYNYLWNSNVGLSNIYVPNPTVSLTTAGTKNYDVVVTNNSTGCATTASTTVTATACTLPIKLENFTAAPLDKTVLLSWVVSEEINVLKYEIEFSTDGRSFWTIGSRAATNSTNYNLVHNSPVFGINYYRLKTIDKDGRISYSEIRTVNFKLAGNLTIYPNPANDILHITFAASSINKSATISVIAMDGKIMYQKNITKLSQTETLDVSKLANGCYIMRVLTNEEVINKSVLVYK